MQNSDSQWFEPRSEGALQRSRGQRLRTYLFQACFQSYLLRIAIHVLFSVVASRATVCLGLQRDGDDINSYTYRICAIASNRLHMTSCLHTEHTSYMGNTTITPHVHHNYTTTLPTYKHYTHSTLHSHSKYTFIIQPTYTHWWYNCVNRWCRP